MCGFFFLDVWGFLGADYDRRVKGGEEEMGKRWRNGCEMKRIRRGRWGGVSKEDDGERKWGMGGRRKLRRRVRNGMMIIMRR